MEHYFDKHHCCDDNRHVDELEHLLHEYFHEHHDFHCEDFVHKLKDLLTNISWGSLKGSLDNQTDLRIELEKARNTADWGNIEGAIQNQKDLIEYINCKQSNWEQIKHGKPENNSLLNEYVIKMIKLEFQKDWINKFVAEVIEEQMKNPNVIKDLIDTWLKDATFKNAFKKLIFTLIKENPEIIEDIKNNPDLSDETCDCLYLNK